MSLEEWIGLLDTAYDDPQMKAVLAKAGIKRKPRLPKDETSVQVEIKGGLELIFTDESVFSKAKNKEVGEGSLILSGVVAKLDKKQGDDLYKGMLPFNIPPNSSQVALRKLLGKPNQSGERHPVDTWIQNKREITARFTKDCESISTFSVQVPGIEF